MRWRHSGCRARNSRRRAPPWRAPAGGSCSGRCAKPVRGQTSEAGAPARPHWCSMRGLRVRDSPRRPICGGPRKVADAPAAINPLGASPGGPGGSQTSGRRGRPASVVAWLAQRSRRSTSSPSIPPQEMRLAACRSHPSRRSRVLCSRRVRRSEDGLR